MNGTNDKQAESGLLFPGGGEGSAVKAVTKVEHQHHVPRGQGVSKGGCDPMKN